MMKGMEDFMFKNSIINFDDKKKPVKTHLWQGITCKGSYSFKIFDYNLQAKIEEVIKETGMHPLDLVK